MKKSQEVEDQLEQAGLDVMEYDSKRGRYRIRLQPGEIEKHKELLTGLIKTSYSESSKG